ncbi:ArnT family glycosyltransferase [Celerinatantimonas yamalensis]|uniref:Glycosyltransferase family 39 protein n=1 Tax=Celerinatantimonas yamalensis TaxID=559956 RepID=A0ABW9G5H8_9GAMM
MLNFIAMERPATKLSRLTQAQLWAGSFTLLVVLVSLLSRYQLPIDETRYVSVAWDMWQHHQWLLPELNGAPYADKPPLLMWLINLSWAIFGVYDWSARIVVGVIALSSLYWLARLAGALFDDVQRSVTPWVLVSLLGWCFYVPMEMFDTLLATCLLAQFVYWIQWLKQPQFSHLVMIGLCGGLGILAKGPVMLLDSLPMLLCYPLWRSPQMPQPQTFYKALLWSTLIGIGIGLAWAIPAAIVGGKGYAEAIFIKQSVGRIQHSFAHARPWYWYLPLLPLITFPWSLLGVNQLFKRHHFGARVAAFKQAWVQHWPLRLLSIWVFAHLILFSLISGKQLHYLVPIFPAVALLMSGYCLPQLVMKSQPWWLVAVLLGFTAALASVPWWSASVFNQGLKFSSQPLAALIPFGLAVVLSLARCRRYWPTILLITSPLLICATLWAGHPLFKQYFNLQPAAQFVADQQETQAVAFWGDYPDFFQFYGRLQHPLVLLGKRSETEQMSWVKRHSNNWVISTRHICIASAVHCWEYQTDYLVAQRADVWMAHKGR